MRYLFIFLLFPCMAFSQSETLEISAAPMLAYSNYYGLSYGGNLAADFFVSQRWQVGFGGALFDNENVTDARLYFGPTYNFSDDVERAFFLGGGIGYENHFGPDNVPTAIGYVKFGKRFLLSENYHITYKPSIGVTGGRRAAEVNISFLTFSIFF